MLVIVNRNIHENGDNFNEYLQFLSVSKEKRSFLSRVMTVDTDYIRFYKKLDSKRVKKCEKIRKKRIPSYQMNFSLEILYPIVLYHHWVSVISSLHSTTIRYFHFLIQLT